MVDGVNKTGGPIEGQKFSKNGVKLSDLKGNAPLFNYFKSKGLDEESFVYETDVEALKKEFAGKDGEFQRKEVKKGLGIEGSKKELKAAANMLNKISTTPLAELEKDGLYPTRVNDKETAFYDAKGTIILKHTQGENGAKKLEQYEGGNTELVNYLEETDGKTTTITAREFDEKGRTTSLHRQQDGNVVEDRKFAYNGDKLHYTVDKDKKNASETTTFYDDLNQPTRIVTKQGELVTTIENEYDGNQLVKKTTEGTPEQIKSGVQKEVLEFSGEGQLPAKKTVTKADGTVDEFEYKDGQETPVQKEVKPHSKEFDNGGKKVNVEYDGAGNTYAVVKNGESFKGTAKRLLGKDATEEQIKQFRELNADKIKQFGKNKVESFMVGDKVKVSGELALDEKTKDILTVDPKKEQAAYKAQIDKIKAGRAAVNAGKKDDT